MGLRAAEPAVRADLLLERRDLLELRVVAAVDHQVGDRAVAVDLGDLLAGPRAERRQRVVAGHLTGDEVDAAVAAEHDRGAARLADEHEPDLRDATRDP